MKRRGISGLGISRKATDGTASVARRSSILDGRPGFQLQSSWGSISVLEGGGHICGLTLNAVGTTNPM